MVKEIYGITRKNSFRIVAQDFAERVEFFTERSCAFLHDAALRQIGIEFRSDIQVAGTVKRRAVMFVVGIEPRGSDEKKNADEDGKLFQTFAPAQIEKIERQNAERQRYK